MKIQNITSEITIPLTKENHYSKYLPKNIDWEKSKQSVKLITRSASPKLVQFDLNGNIVWGSEYELRNLQGLIQGCSEFRIWYVPGTISPFAPTERYDGEFCAPVDGYEMHLAFVLK